MQLLGAVQIEPDEVLEWEDFPLFDGDVTLWFTHAKHYYLVDDPDNGLDDFYIPSPSSILKVIDKPALIPWAVKVTVEWMAKYWRAGVAYDEVQIKRFLANAKKARFSTEAVDIGSLAHNFTERYAKLAILTGMNPAVAEAGDKEKYALHKPHNKEANKAVQHFLKFIDENEVEFLETETKVYSREEQFAGTADLVARINGLLTLLDYKTSKGIYDEYWLQAAAYAKAKEEEGKYKFDQIGVLRIPKTGRDFEVGFRNDQDELYEVFKACRKVYNFKKAEEERAKAKKKTRRKKTTKSRRAKASV